MTYYLFHLHRYDGLNRLIEIAPTNGDRRYQFFYGAAEDILRPSHVAYGGHEYQLYYDHRMFLMAMQRDDGEMFYTVSDNVGSPIAVFSQDGQLIKQVPYLTFSMISVIIKNSSYRMAQCWP